MASDITLTDNYHKISSVKLPEGLRYDKGLCFEEYYAIAEAFLDKNLQSPQYEIEGIVDDGGGAASEDADSEGASGTGEITPQGEADDIEDEGEKTDGYEEQQELQRIVDDAVEEAGLWEEDQLAAEQVKETVRRAQRSKQWGSLSGGLKDEIEATTIVRIDYRTILSGFRASVLCSKRRLTRMIPSRRYGFQYMGSKRDFATRLLVAIDVSGSVDDRQVAQALSIINRFFKYGVENVDVIQFDVDINGEVLPMKKAKKSIKIEGRGGTDFQAAINYFLSNKYDGLIMITDGYAAEPKLPKSFYGNILWMLYDEGTYRSKSQTLPAEHQWLAQLPKSKYTILPPV